MIVEGPDGAGKSRLITTIVEKLWPDAMVEHHGAYLGEAAISQYYKESLKLGTNGRVIMDRSWLAEPIYGAVMRGGTNRVSADDEQELLDMAIEAHAVVVMCLPPFPVCLSAWRSRRHLEYPTDESRLYQIHRLYGEHFTEWSPLVRLFHDWTHDRGADALVETLRRMLP